MTTTIYNAPPGMVFVTDEDYAELQEHRAKVAGKSPWRSDSMPKYGKWVLVKCGKNGRVFIAKRVKRQELKIGGQVKGIINFESRHHALLVGINLWMEIPK